MYPLNVTQLDMLSEVDALAMETTYAVNVFCDVPVGCCTAEEIAAAAQTVLDTLRYTHVHLVRTGQGRLMVSEDASMPNRVWRSDVSDEQWDGHRRQMMRPFRLLEEPGLRIHVMKTPTRIIFGMEYCHLFFDGMSMASLVRAVEDALAGRPLLDQGDVAARWNCERPATFGGAAYRRAQAACLARFRGVRFTDICRPVDQAWGETLSASALLRHDDIQARSTTSGATDAVRRRHAISTVVTAAYALALGRMAGTDDVAFLTTRHGRTDRRIGRRTLGNFMQSLPIRISIDGRQTAEQMLTQTRTALFASMRTMAYPWLHLMRDLDIAPSAQAVTEMNVSGSDIYECFNVHGVDYPTYHVAMPRTDTHLLLVVQTRQEGYTFQAEGSGALYSQQQLDSVARLTAHYALQLMDGLQRRLHEL